MTHVTLKQLRYFDALARELHFWRAADACAVTQPALSMQIHELEQNLGLVLVERTRDPACSSRPRARKSPAAAPAFSATPAIWSPTRSMPTACCQARCGLA